MSFSITTEGKYYHTSDPSGHTRSADYSAFMDRLYPMQDPILDYGVRNGIMV